MKLLTYNWVQNFLKDEGVDEDKLKQSFGLAATYRSLLQHHIQRELDKLDKLSRIDSLADKPNRAELLIAYQGKRDALNNFLEYVIDKT